MKFSYKRLDELGSVSRGRSKHRPRNAPELYGGPYPFVQTADVKKAGLYLTEYSQTYSEKGLAQSKLWPKGTLCITIAANIADTAILGVDACFPDSVIGFISDDSKSDVKYVKYLFDYTLQTEFKKFSQGAAQDNLSQEKLLSIKLPVPDVEFQNRIVAILSDYDSAIDNARRQIALLEEAAMRLYREWFVVNADPKWEKGAVRKWFEITIGRTPPRKIAANFSEAATDQKWCSIKDLQNSNIFISETAEMLTKQGVESSKIHISPAGTIFLSFKLTVGKVAITLEPMATNEAIAHFETTDRALRDYTYCYLHEFQYDTLGSTSSIGKAINSEIVRDMLFVMPDAKTLTRFSDMVSPIFDQIQNSVDFIRTLTEARDRLLPKLMSGEVSV